MSYSSWVRRLAICLRVFLTASLRGMRFSFQASVKMMVVRKREMISPGPTLTSIMRLKFTGASCCPTQTVLTAK